jgi:hypothetical protein
METGRENMVTVLWSQQVQADRTIRNKPDIISCVNEKGTYEYLLIDTARRYKSSQERSQKDCEM